jgi:putative Mg2+ transporter-C (MgtC) family protein
MHDLTGDVIGRLLLAAVLGGLVGLERELRHKPAGLRTMILIAIGAALFTVISYQAAGSFGGDHTRIAAQVIPGIGFIGAGVVLRDRGSVTGITSAATIFVIASVGMAAGAAMPVTAIFTTLLLLVSLVILGKFEDRFNLRTHEVTFTFETPDLGATSERVHKLLEDAGLEPHRWKTRRGPEGTIVEFDTAVTVKQERDLVSQLQALHLHCEVHRFRP